MLLSYSHQFLFVHVPKTAGMSVTECLASYAHRPQDVPLNRLLNRIGLHANLVLGPHHWRWFRKHHGAAVVQRHLPAVLYERLFKFAFVRNPWDRAVSFYHFCLQNPNHHRHEHVARMDEFSKFIEWRTRSKRHIQAAMVMDRNDRPLVDFIGRYETLADDFHHVCRQVGIQAALPKINTSRHRDYRSYYTDETAELVATRWRRDIEVFGYTFDGVEADQPTTLQFTSGAPEVVGRSWERRAAA